MLAGA
jgi:hypothetical protein